MASKVYRVFYKKITIEYIDVETDDPKKALDIADNAGGEEFYECADPSWEFDSLEVKGAQ